MLVPDPPWKSSTQRWRRNHLPATPLGSDQEAAVLFKTKLLEPFYTRYERLAVRIGITGNGLFVVGSILFLVGADLTAKLCWILGSSGMLVRAVGRLYADERKEYDRVHGRDGGEAMAAARRDLGTSPE